MSTRAVTGGLPPSAQSSSTPIQQRKQEVADRMRSSSNTALAAGSESPRKKSQAEWHFVMATSGTRARYREEKAKNRLVEESEVHVPPVQRQYSRFDTQFPIGGEKSLGRYRRKRRPRGRNCASERHDGRGGSVRNS